MLVVIYARQYYQLPARIIRLRIPGVLIPGCYVGIGPIDDIRLVDRL